MSTIGNNDSEKIAFLRESYFDSEGEKEFLVELLQDPKERKIHEKLVLRDAKKLAKLALDIIQKVESGAYNEKEMAEAEYMLTHLLAAIKDIQLALELELLPDFSEDELEM